MRYFLIELKDPEGYKVTYMTGEKTPKALTKLINKYGMVIDTLEKAGFERVKVDVPQQAKKPLESTTAPQRADYCKIHGVQMTQKEGKYGKFYSHRLEDGSWCNGK